MDGRAAVNLGPVVVIKAAMQTADDIRYAVRVLARQRTFTLTAVVSLALASAAATTAYAVAHGLLWKPLPYRDAGALVAVWETQARSGYTNRNEASFGNFLVWRDRASVFEHLTALAYRNVNLTGAGEPERLQAAAPSVDFFEMLGVQPVLGRTFLREEESPSAEPVAVISHALWVRRFGGHRSIVGARLALNGISTTVVGVLPPSFTFEFPTSRAIDVWVPRVVTPQARQSRRARGLYVVGRLKAGVPLDDARAEMSRIAAQLAAEHPVENRDWSALVVPLHEQIAGGVRSRVLFVFGAGLVVLLIACGNVAALQVANVAARRRELAIRTAIGAAQRTILRQFFTESFVLSSVSTAAGVLLASWFLDAIASGHIGVELPRTTELGVDPAVVLFGAVVAVATATIIALVPAQRVTAGEIVTSLRQAPFDARQRFVRQPLIVAAEVALAVVLLVAAMLLFRSFTRLQTVDTGFSPDHVLAFELSLPASRYASDDRISQFYTTLMERLRMVPGVASAGAISNLPLGGSSGTVSFSIDGREPASPDANMEAEFRAITAGYFDTLAVPLRSGRFIVEFDTAAAPAVVVINESMSRRWWPDHDPIGSRIRFSAKDSWRTIVGVVGDVRHSALEADPRPELYVPQTQFPNDYMHVVLRTSVSPESISAAVAARVHAVDPELPLYRMQPMTALVDRALARPRATTTIVGLFAIVAALLAIGGTYGVVTYVTGRRRREIGVRLALGATRRQVVQVLLRDGTIAAASGVLAGTATSLAVTRLMEWALFGISAHDPITFACIPATIFVATTAASAAPAWRTSRLDPMSVLRAD